MNLQTLKDELVNDPLGRGYSGMTDVQAAIDLLTKYRSRNKTTMTSAEIFECVDVAEYLALTAPKRQGVDVVMGLGGDVAVGPSSKARAFMLDAFGAGSATRIALVAAVVESISRATQLFGADLTQSFGQRTAVEVVAAARALP